MAGQATEVWSPEFARSLDALDPGSRRRVLEAIRDLGRRLDSFPHHRMQSCKSFRLRAGDHRVIYQFHNGENTLLLVTVGHRREIYR